ncbi:hypothetical protein [Rathayibacter sp. Leaf248]|uniref:hypothetical protein n=1 Tax=Rathayibacter sp. Leaf248 TaxID=2876555 RepID=UPI001E5C4965|nr:hypothetical protein [Rathayibacter sp. Leaf248]
MSAPRPDTCAEPGPYGSHCTDYLGHRYSHYDAGDDRSWQDDWREDISPAGGGTYEDDEESDDA